MGQQVNIRCETWLETSKNNYRVKVKLGVIVRVMGQRPAFSLVWL
jgi:hypothetical protein